VTADTDDCVIHILGANKGESIVVKTKLGFGLIDCFKHGKDNPPLELLKKANADSLAFLALTHPHDDHFDGMEEIVEYFLSGGRRIQYFWRYPVLTAKHVKALLDAKGASTQSKKLLQTFAQLLAARVPIKTCGVGQMLLSDSAGHGVEIEAIAPAAEYCQKADEILVESISRGVVSPTHLNWDLNQVSSAFLVRYGKKRLVLAGDVPGHGWTLAEADPAWPKDCGLNVYKSAHHGSGNDNTPQVMSILSNGGAKNWAFVTRYERHNLPDANGLKTLHNQFENVRVIGRRQQSPRVLGKSPRLEELQKYAPEILTVRLKNGDIHVGSSHGG
jgi:beta-lactamase superfamily II metal-dependent hydrolase